MKFLQILTAQLTPSGAQVPLLPAIHAFLDLSQVSGCSPELIKSRLLSKIGCFSLRILFIGLPTVSVSAEAERIDLHLTLPGCELKGGKELLAASSNIVISFFFLIYFFFSQGCRAKIIWL